MMMKGQIKSEGGGKRGRGRSALSLQSKKMQQTPSSWQLHRLNICRHTASRCNRSGHKDHQHDRRGIRTGICSDSLRAPATLSSRQEPACEVLLSTGRRAQQLQALPFVQKIPSPYWSTSTVGVKAGR